MQIANHSGRIPNLTAAADDAQETQEQELNHFVLHRIRGHAQVMYANLDSMTARNRSSAWDSIPVNLNSSFRVRNKSGMFDCFRVARDTTAIPDHPLLVVSAVA